MTPLVSASLLSFDSLAAVDQISAQPSLNPAERAPAPPAEHDRIEQQVFHAPIVRRPDSLRQFGSYS